MLGQFLMLTLLGCLRQIGVRAILKSLEGGLLTRTLLLLLKEQLFDDLRVYTLSSRFINKLSWLNLSFVLIPFVFVNLMTCSAFYEEILCLRPVLVLDQRIDVCEGRMSYTRLFLGSLAKILNDRAEIEVGPFLGLVTRSIDSKFGMLQLLSSGLLDFAFLKGVIH